MATFDASIKSRRMRLARFKQSSSQAQLVLRCCGHCHLSSLFFLSWKMTGDFVQWLKRSNSALLLIPSLGRAQLLFVPCPERIKTDKSKMEFLLAKENEVLVREVKGEERDEVRGSESEGQEVKVLEKGEEEIAIAEKEGPEGDCDASTSSSSPRTRKVTLALGEEDGNLSKPTSRRGGRVRMRTRSKGRSWKRSGGGVEDGLGGDVQGSSKGEGKEKVKSKGPKSPRRQRRERSKGKAKRDFTGAEEGPKSQEGRAQFGDRQKGGYAPHLRQGFPMKMKKDVAKEVEDAVAAQTGGSLTDGGAVSFEDLSLHKELLEGIKAHGMEKPAPVQAKAIPICVSGKDAIIQAQSGMGKTAALVISVLQRLDRDNSKCQALLLVPTRELAGQMLSVVEELSKFMVNPKPVTTILCVGGSKDTDNLQKLLEEGAQIVIGTPGRVTHMLEEGFLRIKSLKMCAVDEADQFLDYRTNFWNDLELVLLRLPFESQVVLMSATMPIHILKRAWSFTKNPALVLVRNHQLTLEGIRQFHVKVTSYEDKVAILKDLWSTIGNCRGLIFCKNRKSVEEVAKAINSIEPLLQRVEGITGDNDQPDRDRIMESFRRGDSGFNILVASDLLGRGIDVQDVNLVVNFDLPEYELIEQYIHRVGRAGRFGRKGIAISLMHAVKDRGTFVKIQEFFETVIPELPPLHELEELIKTNL